VISIAAWLVFGIALPSDASQTIMAVPFSSLDACTQRMERILPAMLGAADVLGAGRRPITIKPYCTTVAPAFWIPPREAF
jgi:hypothetical protein